VFVTERKAPMTDSTVRKLVARAGEAAQLEMPSHPHMLRHAAGFKLANDGQDTRAIQHYLGHRNIQHTTCSTELAPDRFNDFLEGLNACVGRMILLNLLNRWAFKNFAVLGLEPPFRGVGRKRPALRNGEGSMAVVIRCEEFKVPCAPDEESCEVCVLRLRALEREAARAGVEARRRQRAGETAHALGKAQVK
jgi:hypothetical protein